ncbi:MAG: Txe/YoeB family addiction module toxin [Bacteroidales bacterium]|nr:Txe/YoeB family addiction module toxin [Candidatus Colicola caccequi]
MFELLFSQTAQKDVLYFKRLGNKTLIAKIDRLLEEVEQHPFSGTGRPEILRYELAGFMSRRINSEHRLVYRVNEEAQTVEIITMKGHYKKL